MHGFLMESHIHVSWQLLSPPNSQILFSAKFSCCTVSIMDYDRSEKCDHFALFPNFHKKKTTSVDVDLKFGMSTLSGVVNSGMVTCSKMMKYR